MKNILKQLAKSVLILLELTAAVAVVVYAGIHKNLLNQDQNASNSEGRNG